MTVVAIATLAACGSSSGGASSAASSDAPATTTTVAVDGVASSAPASSAASASSAATTAPPSTSEAPPTTAAPTTVATTAPAASDLRACVQGDWVMKTDTLDLLVATVLPVPGLTVSYGGLRLSFAADEAVYKGAGTLRFVSGSSTSELDWDWTHRGTYQVNEGLVLMNYTDRVNNVGEARADGFSVPGLPTPTPPEVAGGPATCTPTLLTFTSTSTGANTISLVFERAA